MRILFTTFYDPNYLGIRYLAAVLKNAGHEVAICQLKDFHHFPIDPGNDARHTGYFIYSKRFFLTSGDSVFPITKTEMGLFEECVRQFRPDMVGITNRSPYNHLLPDIIPAIRRGQPHTFLVAGGYGPTFNPEISLNLGADAVIRGEGEHAILELAGALEEGRDWHDIKNMAWLKEGDVQTNPLRPLITDLDALPFPLYYGDHFFSIDNDRMERNDMRLRSTGGIHSSTYNILTGRGCIGRCSYCAGGNWRAQYRQQGLAAPPLRTRSLSNVIAELRHAKQHGEKYITFCDEYLVRNSAKLQQFFEEYAKEIDLPFFGHFHYQQLMEENDGHKKLLETVQNAGLDYIAIGVQSASEDFARRIYHRKNKNSDILEAINTFKDHGFAGNIQIIGGNALETEADREELFNFCASIPFDPSLKTNWYLHSAILRLLEGSPLAVEHPELAHMSIPPAQFSEFILLADLRNKVDQKTFENIRNNPFYRNHPQRLYTLLLQTIRDLHSRYLVHEADRLKGQEVYFYGHGEIYQYRSALFRETRPVCILADNYDPNQGRPEPVNGLEIFHPSEKLSGQNIKPIIAFSQSPHIICNKIRRHWPEYTDIVTCAML